MTLIKVSSQGETHLLQLRIMCSKGYTRDQWEDQDVDGRIILRWIFRKREGVVGTGWS
jgi:hypothetical protein